MLEIALHVLEYGSYLTTGLLASIELYRIFKDWTDRRNNGSSSNS